MSSFFKSFRSGMQASTFHSFHFQGFAQWKPMIKFRLASHVEARMKSAAKGCGLVNTYSIDLDRQGTEMLIEMETFPDTDVLLAYHRNASQPLTASFTAVVKSNILINLHEACKTSSLSALILHNVSLHMGHTKRGTPKISDMHTICSPFNFPDIFRLLHYRNKSLASEWLLFWCAVCLATRVLS